MADSAPSSGKDGGHVASAGTARRPRAPTITIDTSAVQRSSSRMSRDAEEELDQMLDDRHSFQSDHRTHRSHGLWPQSNGPSTPTELRGTNSFDSRDSRPTSPHNVSSPTLWNNPQNFLAVPVQRSRGGSIDTEVSGDSVGTSDITYVNSASPLTEHAARPFCPDDRKLGAGDHPVLPDDEALEPDKGTEADFVRPNNPFAFTPGQLGKMFNPKSLGAFHALGGPQGLEKGLRTDCKAGLKLDEEKLDGSISFGAATASDSPASDRTVVEPETVTTKTDSPEHLGSYADRKRIFNDNRLPQPKQKTILQLMWLAYNDKVLILLTVCAVIALALGLYERFTSNGVEWIEGVAIIVAIAVVVFVGAINDWQKEKQFAKLNAKKDNRNVKVVRSGNMQELNVHDILVGDILNVEPGDILPVDGILIEGSGVKCDESSATGESDILRKVPADEVYRAMGANEPLKKQDPFMISGGKVTEGYGKMLVVATGVHSSIGKTMLSLQEGSEATPLQTKLNKLAEYIAKIGSAAALLLFLVALIRFLADLPHNHNSPAQKGDQFLQILIVAVTIVVVAVPEGLPLAVTLSLAYATKRMLKDNNLVRVLKSCETMGNATTICSDKTGTLTQNVMTVVAGTVGTSNRFSNLTQQSGDNSHVDDDVRALEVANALSHSVKVLWKDSIAINSTAFETKDQGKTMFVGSKTETALLDFARDLLGMELLSVERSNAQVVQLIPFDSGRKCMGTVIKVNNGKTYRLLVKGASEIMLRNCTKIIRDPTKEIDSVMLTNDNRKTLSTLIDAYASRSLRTIGFIYRDFESWPPRGARRQEDDKSRVVFADICRDMTFLGLVGIQDPLRPGVADAVKDCIMAGVFPRMVTGDNILTAKAIAQECGIFTPGGVAIEGPEFRKMSDAEQRSVIPKLQVLARSSPDDKRKLVKWLKEMGETVAVTGDGTNDAPALKAADVGFAMNIAGTEVAKEASDIILMDDNFKSIVLALMWGRAVNDSVRKFLQFQVTVNITAVMLAFISAVSSSHQESVLTAVQLLWVNLIMDTMAALALATDPPTRTVLNRKPDPKSAPLISITMWKMIIGQATYQLTVTLVLYFAGNSILNFSNNGVTQTEHRQLQTLVFNTFVWMQIFNALNNRRLDNRFNIFEGILNNWFFISIFLIMVGGQTLIIFVGGWPAFQAVHQTGAQWAIALILGVISLPIGVVVRLVPDELAVRLVPEFIRSWSNKKGKIVIQDEESPFRFNQALYDIQNELAFIKRYKGGRLNNLKFVVRHPREALQLSRTPSRARPSSSLPRTPNNEPSEDDGRSGGASLSSAGGMPPSPDSRRRLRTRSRSNSAFAGAAMAGVIAGSIAGAWSPIDRREGDVDSLHFGSIASSSRQRSKSELSRDVKLEPHPNTQPSDILVIERPVEEADGLPPSQSTNTTPRFGERSSADEPTSKDGSKAGKR